MNQSQCVYPHALTMYPHELGHKWYSWADHKSGIDVLELVITPLLILLSWSLPSKGIIYLISTTKSIQMSWSQQPDRYPWADHYPQTWYCWADHYLRVDLVELITTSVDTFGWSLSLGWYNWADQYLGVDIVELITILLSWWRKYQLAAKHMSRRS
jgi:hypothetical protein